MKIFKFPDQEQLNEILKRPVLEYESLNSTVGKILTEVKSRGDQALIDYTLKFDGIKLDCIKVSKKELAESGEKISDQLKDAIRLAISTISKFHKSQDLDLPVVETIGGVTCWQKAVPVEKVGLYVPGGSAPLFSTVLMLALPAKIAGCKEIILCTPCSKNGNIDPAVLYAAREAGVSSVFKIGGAQAIAAMAYGTESIPKVYKIFGPGNQYVTAAKQLLSLRDVAIDMPAGPSEVEILADETANPEFIAADLLSQAEHGADSQSILVTTSEKIADEVYIETLKQADKLSRKDIVAKSLNICRIILVKDIDEAIRVTNEYAPEHLIISTDKYLAVSERIVNAGSVFLGNLTPESAGDYASGTNHTLPTNGYAKMYSGVNLDSFKKKITFQEITPQGLNNIGKAVEIMAEAEQLTAHKNAMTLRLNTLKK